MISNSIDEKMFNIIFILNKSIQIVTRKLLKNTYSNYNFDDISLRFCFQIYPMLYVAMILNLSVLYWEKSIFYGEKMIKFSEFLWTETILYSRQSYLVNRMYGGYEKVENHLCIVQLIIKHVQLFSIS